jgi:hypothetical protein
MDTGAKAGHRQTDRQTERERSMSSHGLITVDSDLLACVFVIRQRIRVAQAFMSKGDRSTRLILRESLAMLFSDSSSLLPKQ